MKVTVVGCGYVGLVTGVGLAAAGHRVTGIESDDSRRQQIAEGHPPFYEPGLDEALARVLGDGSLSISGDLTETVSADVVMLAVQTPPAPDGSNDLSYLREAVTGLSKLWSESPETKRVLATRSTVLPGTADDVIAPILRDAGLTGVAVAANPEFLQEGSAVKDFSSPDRVVVGCHEPWGLDVMRELYAPLNTQFVATAPAAAELAKYASNALLATMVSFSNEIATICEGLPGVDVEDVLGVLHLDRRLGVEVAGRRYQAGIVSYLKAGCGYGGSCLPKDLSALITSQSQRGREVQLLQAVRAINEGRANHVVKMVEEAVGDLEGRRIGVLGAAFKGGTDDLRDSPGLKITEALQRRGARVVLHDPLVSRERLAHLEEVDVTGDLGTALEVEAVVVTTNAEEFQRLHEVVTEKETAPVIIDGRRYLDPASFGAAFRAIGLGSLT